MSAGEASDGAVAASLRRSLGQLWASPLTLAGLVVAMALGGRPRAISEGAIDLLAPARGPLAWFFRRFGVVACTWGATIVYRDGRALSDARLRRHERAHVRQCLRLGPLMIAAYPLASLWALARGGHAYRDNAFEREARAQERGGPSAA